MSDGQSRKFIRDFFCPSFSFLAKKACIVLANKLKLASTTTHTPNRMPTGDPSTGAKLPEARMRGWMQSLTKWGRSKGQAEAGRDEARGAVTATYNQTETVH